MHKYRIAYNESELPNIAKKFLAITGENRHISFYGDMGSGKTTLIIALCQTLGTLDMASSPSFAIINEYTTLSGDNIFHFDFYRIKNPLELLDLGFHEYCTGNAYCFIEWPEKAEAIIPDDFIRVSLTALDDGSRTLTFTL